MRAFLIRRVALMVVALMGVLVVMFLLMHLAPVDPARQYAGNGASKQTLERVRVQLGLNKSLPEQVVVYIKNFFEGKWGDSLQTKQPVIGDIRTTLPYTLELVIVAMGLTVLIGVPLGVVSAGQKDRWPDHASRILAVGLISIPTFWLALALQYILSGKLGILPLSGPQGQMIAILHPIRTVTGFPLIDSLITGNFTAFQDHLVHMVLPVIALTGMSLGGLQRITRAAMVETLSDDYIVAKRSYGLPERAILFRHGLRNSSGPIVTYTATTFAWLLVNTFLVEAIFSWPGMGAYLAQGVQGLDYPVVMAVTLVSAVAFLVLNFLADVLIALDPRVRQTS
jgi:peptide/nickel transport system permease protein